MHIGVGAIGLGIGGRSATSGVTISGVSLAGSTLSMTLSGAATVYWLINASATQLTAAQVIAGTGATLDGSFAAGSGATSEPVDISALAVGDWYIHVAADNGTDTDVAAPVGFHVTPRVTVGTITPSATGASVAWSTTGGDGTAYWVVSTNSTETDATIKAGTSVAISASGSQTALAPSGLSSSTVYYVHILHTDGDGQDGAAVHQTFTTSAASSSPAFVAAGASTDYTFSTDCVLTYPSGVTSGKQVLALLQTGHDRTITPPAGWTLQTSDDFPGEKEGALYIFKKDSATSGSESSTNVTFTASAAALSNGIILVVDAPANSVEIVRTTSGNDPAAITPAFGSAEYLIVAAFAVNGVYVSGGNHAINAGPSGYSNFTIAESDTATNGAGGTMAIATKVITGTTENPGAFTEQSGWPDVRITATIAIR